MLSRDNSIVTLNTMVHLANPTFAHRFNQREYDDTNRFNSTYWRVKHTGDSICESLFTTRRIPRDLKCYPIKLWRLSVSLQSPVSISQASTNESEIRERPLARRYRVARTLYVIIHRGLCSRCSTRYTLASFSGTSAETDELAWRRTKTGRESRTKGMQKSVSVLAC